jgi:Transposase C of IS166 homeodomain
MSNVVLTRIPDAAEVASMDVSAVAILLQSQAAQIQALRAQIEWFKRQIFGQKSERYAPLPDACVFRRIVTARFGIVTGRFGHRDRHPGVL